VAPRTSITSNALLGLLELRPSWSTWELVGQVRRNLRFFWPRAESRVYEEARRLEAGGLARAEHGYTGRRRRTVYSITPAGRRRLRAWLDRPPRPTSLECEPLLRVLLADLGTPEQLSAAIDRVRADGEAIVAVGRTVGAEYLDGTAPFQDDVHARALVFDFLAAHALTLIGWAERAELRVAAWGEETPAQREAAAVESIRRRLAELPPIPGDAAAGEELRAHRRPAGTSRSRHTDAGKAPLRRP
jgi:PadR family transcriptional regulator AphA